MTPARKAALKKAQIASARKRKGSGRGRVSAKSRLRAAGAQGKGLKKSSKSKSTSNRRRAVAVVGAVGAVAAASYAYKNREKGVALAAEALAVRNARIKAGRKLTRQEKITVRLRERADHANRSTYRVREYRKARARYRKASQFSGGRLNIRPTGTKNSVYDYSPDGSVTKYTAENAYYQKQLFMSYRRDVYSRASIRLARMKGKKRAFNYDSGKRLNVDSKGKVRRALI
jgi:hypothetical protein